MAYCRDVRGSYHGNEYPLDRIESSSSAGVRPPALRHKANAVLHHIMMERPGHLAGTCRRISSPLCFTRLSNNDSSHGTCAQAVTPALRGACEPKEQTGMATRQHGREAIAPYSTNLTDVEWSLLLSCSNVCRD